MCLAVELRPIPPLPSLGLERRQGGAMMREASPFTVDPKFVRGVQSASNTDLGLPFKAG